jgi:stage II sporulation protein D
LRLVPIAKAGAFDVVNHVPVDDYLKGVLAAELYPEFHPEAYKAQAIAARTYAVYAARTSPGHRHWDLHSDTRSQMYGGIRSETPKSVAAAADTAGVVLAFGPDGQERIFKAYYSFLLRRGDGHRPGRARRVGPGAVRGPVGRPPVRHHGRQYKARFDWGPVVVSRDELAKRFKAWGRGGNNQYPPFKDLVGVRKVSVFRSNAAGRPVSFAVEDARGARFVLGAEQLRLAVNYDVPERDKCPARSSRR